MPVLLFLNERSCAREPCRGDDVRDSMTKLVRVLVAIRRRRSNVALVTHEPLLQLELAQGHPVQRWAADKRCRDEFRLIQSIRNRAPFSAVGDLDGGGVVEYEYQGQAVLGLGYAHVFDGLALSLRLTGGWDEPLLDLKRTMLIEAPDGTVVEDQAAVQVRHASALPHVDVHDEWLRKVGASSLHTGQAVWMNRDDLFPHLTFLPRVERDLARLGPVAVRNVTSELLGLERTASAWNPAGNPEPAWGPNITPEGQQRRQLCRFQDLDGEKRVFDWHARYTPGAGRIHFRLDHSGKRFVVAYVGPKL